MFQKVVNNLNKKRRRSSEGTTRPKPKKVKRTEDWTAARKVHKSSRILHDDYQKIDLMFKSANGTLYQAFERSTGRSVCIKQFEKARTKTSQRRRGRRGLWGPVGPTAATANFVPRTQRTHQNAMLSDRLQSLLVIRAQVSALQL